MKNKLFFLSIFFMFLFAIFLPTLFLFLEITDITVSTEISFLCMQRIYAADRPIISAQKAAVIDVETGQVLYDKHINVKSFPASLTKVLTTIVALEEGELDDVVTVSKRAAYQEGSSIYLEVGEKLKLEDLLYGIMLASGNDASMAVAEHISGSIEGFADLMNEKARQMGAVNSNFVNPSGLPDPDHYSTAYDLAMIMRYALKNEVFREITATKHKTIPWSSNDWGRGLRNHNKLLWSYKDITGGKTGYTKAAGRCLLASSLKEEREVVAVVLDDPDDWFDIRSLLDYGHNEYEFKEVVRRGDSVYNLDWEESLEGDLDLLTEKSIRLLVPRNGKIKMTKSIYLKEELELPIEKGENVGSLSITSNGRTLARIDLIAGKDLHYNSLFLRLWDRINKLFDSGG